MDFLTTARILMDLREKVGPFHYRFEDNGTVIIELRVDEDVSRQFDEARQMFHPA